MELVNACELYGDPGLLGQPANGVTSLAFMISGAVIIARGQGCRATSTYGLLVVAVGVGSFIQHGPNPEWQAYAHDLPLATLLAYVAVDAAADLARRPISPAWWLVVPVVMAPVVAAGPAASSTVQGVLAAVAIGLNLLRARIRPGRRRTLIGAMLILGAGSLVGTLGDRTSLCQPDSLLQGHAFWHLLAALALWRLAPAIGGWAKPDAAKHPPIKSGLAAAHPRRPGRSSAD